jgi:hypothetical protein
VFCQAISITCHSEYVPWQYGRWHHLLHTQLDSWNSCICSTKMVQEPTMIFTSHLNYTTVIACNLSKSGQQVWNLKDTGRQTRVAEGCQSWQRHLSSISIARPS